MTSPSTCVPQRTATHRHAPRENPHEPDHLQDEDDAFLQVRPNPDNGSIQDEPSTLDAMLPRRVPLIVVNDRPHYTPFMVESMKRRLRFFFMDTVQKWKARKQFPWKLLLQVIKIVIVTVQLALFGNARYSHINFYEDNHVALSHLFLKDWDSGREVEAYPPNAGPYAIYTKNEFYEHIDYIVNRYSSIKDIAIGSYDYVHQNLTQAPIKVCKTYYKTAIIWGFNESFIFDSSPETSCLEVVPEPPIDNGTGFDSKLYFDRNNFTIKFERLINVEVKFSLRYILLKALDPMDSPDCYQFDINVVFDNEEHDGIMPIALHIQQHHLHCHADVHYADCDPSPNGDVTPCPARVNTSGYVVTFGEQSHDDKYKLEVAFLNVLNVLVIFVCFLSFLLCSRALIRGQALKYETVQFFRIHFGKDLSVNDRFEFLNVWYVMIIINDVLIIAGSAIKIQIENKVTDSDLYNVCSALLGTGSLLVWTGVLRYLGFFPKYNILILTMRRAVPDILRFLLCALIMYCGFIFCGWLILGPYHIKFRSLSSTAECLFSLINGDDMYATFTILTVKSGLVWWYSRIYMYSFIALFIYVVLSLFIAVIMDAYETIKMHYEQGTPKTDLMEFVSECRDDIASGLFRQESVNAWGSFSHWLRGCCPRGRRGERQPLLGDK